jgi:hypothetical protein
MKNRLSFLRIRALNVWFLLLVSAAASMAHEDNQTHARLTVASFLFLDQTYPEDAALFSSTARGQVRQGSIDEDDTPNFFNHFFNPKTGERGFNADETAPQRASHLWSTGAVARFRLNQRPGAYGNLGQVLHLLQDMTSPAHVHLDVHGFPGLPCEGDNDDFEIWGYCDDYGTNAILQYIAYASVANSQILPPLATGLQRIFGSQPQVSTRLSGENTGYAFVRDVANKVYDFTSFAVTLEDTPSGENDNGQGELEVMFPSLIEDGSGWRINNIGWSAGDCGNPQDQAWWMMEDGRCVEESCGFLCKKVSGYVYIENIGGGDGTGSAIPDNLRPARYNRTWFRQRYGSITNTGVGNSNVTMLRIYGDVLYPAAVAYGAGLLQAFLDEAIMPKPITDKPAQLTGISAQLAGRVRPAGEDAWAWFEWGTNTSYGTATPPSPAGAGQSLMSLYTRIDGLSPDTVYHCRMVSSNRFGVRHGTNQTFRTPAFLVTGSAPNAWQITDRTNSSFLHYFRNLNTTLQQAATNSWRYTIQARMVDDFGGSKCMNFLYGMTASRRFLVWWDLNSDGHLTAEIEGRNPRVIATNGLGAALYHTHEIIYTNGTAKYFFDGIEIDTWPGVDAGATPGGQIAWGSGSSAGMGQMNFHDVEFEIAGSGVVASYHAGTGGVAPNPAGQGWTANPSSPALPNAFTPISPDFEPYLPLVETLGASHVGLATARLNGRGDPRGESARGWFEWGTSVTYGNATAPRDLGDGFVWSNVSENLTGLAADQTYHYRLVVSNGFTVVFGADQMFVTSYPVTIVATEAPQSGQFRLQFTGEAGAAYEVLRSSDLSTWISIGQGVEMSAGIFEFFDTDAPTDSGFYQVRLAVP